MGADVPGDDSPAIREQGRGALWPRLLLLLQWRGAMSDTPDVRAVQLLPPDPVVEAYKAHVDRTLIREQYRRSIDERIARMIGALRLAEELAAAGRRSRR